jgi:hypothetical protein
MLENLKLRGAAPIVFAALFTALPACKKIPPVPVDCTPLDPTNKATPPAMEADGGYPEQLNIVTGDVNGSYFWAHGQGFVDAPVEKVFQALQNPQVVADRRELSSEKIIKTNVDPNSGWSFIMQSVTAPSTGLSFPYEVEWRGSPTTGTEADPIDAIVCGDLFQSGEVAGAPVMDILQDSIVLTAVDANTTAYAAIRHRGDDFSSASACQQYLEDVFNSVIAVVHGNPLPAE